MNGRFLGIGSVIAVAAGLSGLAAALGIFARGDGTYAVVTSPRGVTYEMATSGVYAFNAQRVVAEGVGWDVFTLVVMVPMALFAAVLVARGSYRGRLFAAGVLAYFFYQYPAVYVVASSAMAGAIGAMLLSAWAVEGSLELVPIVIFGAYLAAALALAALIYVQSWAPGSGVTTRERRRVAPVARSA